MQETSNELKIRRIENDIPLVVDLDGTFLNTDLLYESIVLLIKRNPLYVFLIPIWLLQGKIYLKKIFAVTGVSPSAPYKPDSFMNID